MLNKLSDKDLLEYLKLFNNASDRALKKKFLGIDMDPKFAYHIVRLLNEAEQILGEHDLDLERNKEQLKSIRRGEWTLEQIEKYFERKEPELETLYTNCTLQHKPNETLIKNLLIECLEIHYGSLSEAIKRAPEGDVEQILNNLSVYVHNLHQKYLQR